MPRTETERFVHMLHYAEKTLAISNGRNREELESDTTFEFALLYGAQTIGEAAAQISQPTGDRYPQIPWAKIIGFRNRLVHGYDAVNHDILWVTITRDFPLLIDALLQIIPPEHT